MKFRKFVAGIALAVATACAGVTSAGAQGFGTFPDDTFGQSGFRWSGTYVGGQLGGIFGDSDGVIGGGTLGFNVQNGQLVYGLETDLSLTDASGSVDIDWLWTVRGRIGLSMNGTLMPFLTAGLAVADVSATSGGMSSSETSAGYTIGGGLELSLTRNWTFKGEYLYLDLGSVDIPAMGSVAADDLHVIRAGVNFKF